jgi:dihydroorotate dehydrogenase
MREDARWLAVYGAAFVEVYTKLQGDGREAIRECRKLAEYLADAELSTRSEHPFPKEP